MSRLEIKDIYGTKIEMARSRSGYLRLDFDSDSWPDYKHSSPNINENIPYCISLNEDQARILFHSMKILIEEQNDS